LRPFGGKNVPQLPSNQLPQFLVGKRATVTHEFLNAIKICALQPHRRCTNLPLVVYGSMLRYGHR
jgi:hypothetical protein